MYEKLLLLIRAYRFFVCSYWIFAMFALYNENFNFIISGKLAYTHVLLYALKMLDSPTIRAVNQFIIHYNIFTLEFTNKRTNSSISLMTNHDFFTY